MRGSARRLYLLLHAVRQRAVEAEDGGRQAARALESALQGPGSEV